MVWAEDEDAAIRRRLRAIAYRDTTDMSPTDRRTTAEALRTLAVLNRASRRRGDREKSAIVQRPPEFNREPVMCWRSILPAGPTPQALAERAVLAERSRPAQTSRSDYVSRRSRTRPGCGRSTNEKRPRHSVGSAVCGPGNALSPEDTPRRIGMPGIGGM